MLKSTFNIVLLVVALAAVAVVLVLVLRGEATGPPAVHADTGDPQHLVEILQYLGSDYPAAVASEDRGELAEQRSLSSEAVSMIHDLARLTAFAPRIADIDARVQRADDATGVGRDCASLVDDLIAATGIARSPASPPDLESGAHLFAQSCAVCHGPAGHGDGPAASALHPTPADFHADVVMAGLTPYKAFNVVRFGVKGTAMAPFEALDDKQRWALAFYLFSLRQPACENAPRHVSLERLANTSDAELARTEGAGELACLRRRLPELDAPALLVAAHSQVQVATRQASQGDPASAEKAILDAYLTDIEPIEPWLRASDSEMVTQLEASFTTTRAAFQKHDPQAQAAATELLALLDRAGGPRRTTTRLSVFWFAVLVIVREGFEATVIIAALLAVLKKRKETSRAKFVHAGWVTALAVGVVVFMLGRKVLAGAMNEKLEGCLALVAVVMLLHAALWVNARSTTRKTMGELRDRTQGALDQGALALFGIAFLAMFRESFETAVFLEALTIDAPSAVVWGAGVGVLVLLALVLAVGRAGVRLPMQALFKVSTVVLLATAVVLLGQGVHSFEEVGILPSRPMPFLRIEFLGIYPDRVGVIAQMLLAALPLVWTATRRRAERKSALKSAVEPGQ